MKRSFFLLITFLLLNAFIFAQDSTLTFDGYAQLTAKTNFQNYDIFLHRLKLWTKAKPLPGLTFKLQGTFSSKYAEKFLLQDIWLKYKHRGLILQIGQFVPEFSLQRFQHDYTINLYDRGQCVNMLIPDGTLGVRDLGFQIGIKKGKLSTYFGIFSGYGIKTFNFSNNHFLITHKTQVKLRHVTAGYSLMYRRANGLTIPKVLDTTLFTADLRYNVFIRLNWRNLTFQSEYIGAKLNGTLLSGWYANAEYTKGKSTLALTYDQYQNLARIGTFYSYSLHSYRQKIMLGGYWQNNSITALLQIQCFL